jgi:DNA-binding transcriptional LysR family regulator
MQASWSWDHVRIFMEVHRTGRLAAAARSLGQDATTIGRRIASLEQAVGGRLFVRTPEGWQLTDLGQALLPGAEAMEQGALAVGRASMGLETTLSGKLRLACVAQFAEAVLLPYLLQFTDQHPEVSLELVTSASLADLSRREADIAVRFQAEGSGPPRSVGGRDVLHVKRVGVARLGLFASDTYLETHPHPTTLTELAEHKLIGKDERGADVPGYTWLTDFETDHRPQISLRCNPHPVTRAAIEAGFGIGLIPRFTADAYPRLVRVLPDVQPAPQSIWLVVHRDLRKVARVMALSDHLTSVLSDC